MAKILKRESSHLFISRTMNPQPRTIAILGMHRSGTSALTGCLEQAGLYLGDTNQQADDNIKGNRESIEILTLHNDLLQRNGGSWDKPVKNLQWHPVHRALQTTIIKTFSDQPVWGFKDPRTLLTADRWLKAIPQLELVGIFRHPFLVAKSLMNRDDMTAQQALDLWYCYNFNLHWLADNKGPVPIIEFSINATDWGTQLKELIKILKLDSSGIDFFDNNLRTQDVPDFSDQALAQRCLKLYESLKDTSLNSIANNA